MLTQAVHDASAVTAPALGSSGATLSLTLPASAVNPTSFDASSDSVTTHLRVNEGAGPVSNYLTNSHVSLSGLSFSNVGLAGSKGSIKIRFTLTYKNYSGRDEYNFSKTFYGAASLR